MNRNRRRAAAGAFLLGLLVVAFTATWLAANGECVCGWGVFIP